MMSLLRAVLTAALVAHTVSASKLDSRHVVANAPVLAEQIHLSLGVSQSDVYVNYVTMAAPSASYVTYGTSASSLNQKSAGTVSQFVDNGKAQTVRWMHEAALLNLDLGQQYFYQVHTDNTDPNALPMFNFTTISPKRGYSPATPLRIAMFGDMGVQNDQSQKRLEKEGLNDLFDLVFHVGDMAYDLYERDGKQGDDWFNLQQALSAHTFYQVTAGNHESAYNFSHYINRYRMPGVESGSGTNLYSSFNVGPVHFISIDTELYFYDQYYNETHVMQQYTWLEADLKKAVANRSAQPWIVVGGHRPLYCSDDTDDDPTICTLDTDTLREGRGFNGHKRVGALEALFYNYQVDFYFSGHMHSYERLYPTFKGQVLGHDYSPLIAPLHIIGGAAGNRELLDTFDEGVNNPWTAVKSDSYGYGVLEVHNATHAHWKQVLDVDGSTLDELWLVKFMGH